MRTCRLLEILSIIIVSSNRCLPTEVRLDDLSVLLSHSLHRMTLGGKFASFTECRKQFLGFRCLCWDLPIQRVGFVCFFSVLFYSSTYISSDARWRNSRQQVQFLYISWFETSRDCSACTIEH